MRLEFLGKRMKHYQGIDGLGGMLELRRGDKCEVSATVGAKLKQHYMADFKELPEADSAFSEGANKMLPKGAKFKSK